MSTPTYRDALPAIARRKANGVVCDEMELCRRFDDLLGGTFGDDDMFLAFRDVFELVCQPPETVFTPTRESCSIDCELRTLVIDGVIATRSGVPIATIRRRLDFGQGTAGHALLFVQSDFRGVGLAAWFLAHSLDFYSRCGLKRVLLTAGLSTGPYYWAKLGFRFATAHESEKVRVWAAQINAKLELGLDCTRQRTPQEWATLGIDQDVMLSLRELGAAFPDRREQLERRAGDLNLALDDQVAFGKAMLCGVSTWDAMLPVSKGSLATLSSYLRSREEERRRKLVG